MLAYAWMQNFGMSMLWFWLAYVCVTEIGILHTVFNIYVLHMKPMDSKGMGEALLTGLLWAGICIVFDVFGWVLIKHPWSLTFREFYIDYQPWLTLIYLAIFLGPMIGFLLCR